MVIPLTLGDQDPREVYEKNAEQRFACAKFQEALLAKGAYVIDFLAAVKAVETENALNGLSKSDVKTTILDYSGADIYLELELALATKGPYGNVINVTPKMYDAYTQELLGTTVIEGENPVKISDGLTLLGSTFKKAEAKGEIVTLLNNINAKFGEVRTNGRNVKMSFTLETDDYDFDETMNSGETLATEIENWIADEKNALSYDDTKVVGLKMTTPGVRIPLVNEKGRNYKPSNFARDITTYINTLTRKNGKKVKATSTYIGGLISVTFKS